MNGPPGSPNSNTGHGRRPRRRHRKKRNKNKNKRNSPTRPIRTPSAEPGTEQYAETRGMNQDIDLNYLAYLENHQRDYEWGQEPKRKPSPERILLVDQFGEGNVPEESYSEETQQMVERAKAMGKFGYF